MQLSIIKDSEAKRLNPPDETAKSAFLARQHGSANGTRFTVGELLSAGYPVCTDGDWVVGETVQIAYAGQLRQASVAELQFRSGVDETTENPVNWIEAYKDDVLVHRSAQPWLRKALVTNAPTAMLVMTSYGVRLSSDLERRDPRPGRVEYWLKLTPEQATATAERRAEAPHMFEERDTPVGHEVWELVHASAVATQ